MTGTPESTALDGWEVNPRDGRKAWSLRAIREAVISFEAAFTLFLFAGRFKSDPRFDWIPVDATASFFALSVAAGGMILLKRGHTIPRQAPTVVVLVAALAILTILSLLWTPGRIYAADKALYVATLNLWSCAGAALIIGGSVRRFDRFCVLVLAFAVWVLFEGTVALLQRDVAGALTILGGVYLGVARVASYGAIILWAWSINQQVARSRRVLSMLLLAAMLGFLLMVGGRGPLLAVFFAATVPLLVGIQVGERGILVSRPAILSMLLLGVGGGVVVYLFVSGQLTTTLQRFLVLFTEEGGGRSGSMRLQHLEQAWFLWQEAPVLGHGIGSWPILLSQADARAYPHNIIAETAVELGIIGVAIILAIVSLAARSVFSGGVRGDARRLLVAMLFVNSLFNVLISGDLQDNRFLFVIFGLSVIAVRIRSANAELRDGVVPPAVPGKGPR